MGMPLVEELLADGYPMIPFNTSNASKKDAVESLSIAIERKDIVLLDDEVQLDEIESYSSEKLPSGLIRYSAPDNKHDDIVMANCIGWTLAKHDYCWDSRPLNDDEAKERKFQEFLKKYGDEREQPGTGDARR